jgi:hypothetical protein
METICVWSQGSWRNLDELRLVQDAVNLIATEMGSPAKFRSAMGTVKIARWNNDKILPFAPPIGSSVLGDIVLTNYIFDGGASYATKTLIHEFGHVWDKQTGYGLSKGLVSALGTMQCKGSLYQGCLWLPSSSSEIPPGTNAGCSVDDIYNHRPGCNLPYANTYGGGGPWLEDAGWEDWADSFAAYLFPAYQISVGRTNLVPGGVREVYVKFQLEHVR